VLLSESELLPGEHVLVSKHANAVVGIVQAGPGLRGSAGMTGTEAVGGQLYLTDLRLIFRAHRVNRLRGGFTISLSSITQVRDTSSGLRRQVEIVTPLERFTFVVWGVATLIARIEALRGAVAVEPEIPLCYKCGKPLDPGDPRFNLPWPDPVADMTDEERDEHVRFSSDAVVATDNIGGFVRALLPVPLTDARTVTIGVWVSVETDVYMHVSKVGRGELDYTQLQFEGRLANSLEPWGQRILGAPVSAGLPADATRLQMPHVLGSPASEISAVLNGRWRAEDVLTGDMRWALNYDPAAPPTPHHH
jgi:hypothetical protein